MSSTVLITEKIAVFAAMPRASAAMAVVVNAGLWRNMRRECLRSFRRVSIRFSSSA